MAILLQVTVGMAIVLVLRYDVEAIVQSLLSLVLVMGLGLQKVINIYILRKHKVLGVMTRRAF